MAGIETSISEEALLASAGRGDRAALEALIEQNAPAAFCAAFAVLGHRDDALDAAQTALARVARGIVGGRRRADLKSHVFGCAHSAAVDLLRSRISRRRNERNALPTNADRAMDTDKQEQNEALAALREELAQLPAETASLLALHHLDELPVAAVAIHAGLSEEACKKRIQRARDQLRQRLEKRGIALALTLLPVLYCNARAAAAELPAAQFASLARTSISSSSRPSPFQESAGMSKFAIVAAAIVFLLLSLVMERNLQRGQTIAAATPSTPTALPAAQQPKARNDSPAHWQTARFLGNGEVPGSIIVKGSRVLMMVSRAKPATDGSGNLGYFESNDCGETWDAVKWLPPAIEQFGHGFIDADGAAVLLQAYTKRESAEQMTFSTHHDWLILDRSGGAHVSPMPWKFNLDEYMCAGCVLPVTGGTWSFTFRGARAPTFDPDVLAARGIGTDVPQQIETHLHGAGWTGPAAWARDLSIAGIFLLERKGALIHASTRDGGKSWKSTPLPIRIEDGSSSSITPYPVAVISKENRLQLLLAVRSGSGEKGCQDQLFLTVSEDLGETFGTIMPVTEPVANRVFVAGQGTPTLYALGERLFVPIAPTQMKAIGDGAFSGSGKLNDVSTVIETSSDGGKTWQHEDLFNGVPGGTFPLAGCDGESLHIAGYVSGQDKSIIVRSFTRGDFAATPLPAWYKPAPASAAKSDF